MMSPQGEALKVGFDGNLTLEFHGAKVTSGAGLLAYRDLDETLGLFDLASKVLNDTQSGRNTQHDMRALRSLLVNVIKIGAKLVEHGRYLTFPMAEVSVSREIFAEILSRIKRLRWCEA